MSELDASTLRLARNEIYAKHGRKFQTEDLNQYFSQKSWYDGYLSAEEFDDSVLNEYEKENLTLVLHSYYFIPFFLFFYIAFSYVQ